MPSTNQCIGSHYDELKNRIFYFNYNSAGYNGIYIYNVNTNAITPLLISYVDSQEDLFGFDPKFPIASVNILYRTEQDGDILHWTDRNQRPMKINIKEAIDKIYGTAWKKEYLTVARKMPTIAPVCQYGDTANATANNLKSKLFQFSYRWVYNDNTKSTWSPWSKLFTPFNIQDLTTDSDPSKNNVITVEYNTGGADCNKIEISARESIANTFSDRMNVAVIKKGTTPNNISAYYSFYNDGNYPFADAAVGTQLFDYVPKKANTQELLNGNILTYGGITEGNTYNGPISITKTVTNSASGANTAISATSIQSSNDWVFTFSGTPVVGDKIDIDISLTVIEEDYNYYGYTFSYTAVEDDTAAIVRNYFRDAINANARLNAFNSGTTGFKVSYDQGVRDEGIVTGDIVITLANGQIATDVNISAYKHSSTYKFGLVYFDEFGVTNGVITNDVMKVSTPKLYTDSTNKLGTSLIGAPKIEFEISHEPPSWAKSFSFVRTRNLAVSNFVWATTNGLFKDDNYGYINIAAYNANKDGFTPYEYQKGDRIRIYGVVNTVDLQVDIPILDVQTAEPAAGKGIGYWLKVPYESSNMSNWATSESVYLVEPYTPFYNSSDEDQVYYEFGENHYLITDSNGNLSHGSDIQSQIIGAGARPAKYSLYRGDVYNRKKGLYYVTDMSVSDKFNSKIDGNGRLFVVDEYAKETYYPTLIRYSGEYEQGTNINNTNRFAAANLDEYDRQKGDIQRLKSRGQQLRVFQSRACGVVPIDQNVLQTADGGSVVSQSTQILNKIQYYQGEYGIGEQYCSLASSPSADYFTDPVLGCQVRLSTDGITSLTETYKSHFFFTDKISKYQKKDNTDKFGNGGYAKILGVYDSFEEEFLTVMQGSGTAFADYTFGFSETRNAYTAFYDYNPEWITVAGNFIVSWKAGELWVHNNTSAYANFYGVQQTPSIKLVFNQAPNVKKHYNTITTLGNTTWVCPTDADIKTNMNNNSRLSAGDFKIKDDKYHASFKRDVNSPGGIYSGKPLKGSWIELNLKATNPQNLVDLYYAELGILQPLNNR
jgi:hypothetical protein